jgi:IrrE N-terminal-like domain
MITDYKVRRRSKTDVRDLTRRVLLRARIADINFSITRLLKSYECATLVKGKRKATLKIELREEMPSGRPFAYVDFKGNSDGHSDEIILHCHRELWREAEIGEPRAREILAHELGHIVMHNHFALPFSNADAERLRSVSPEESAETQATWFADYILLSDKCVESMKDKETILSCILVPSELAERRIQDFYNAGLKPKDICRQCGCISVLHFEFDNICDDCVGNIQF